MNTQGWRQRFSYISLYLPVRFYFLLFLLLGAAGLWWVRQMQPADPSFASTLIDLLVRVVTWSIIAIFTLGMLSVLIPWALFRWNKLNKKVEVTIDNASAETGERIGRRISMQIKPLLQPIMGFNYFRLVYDGNSLSPKFSLVPNRRQLRWFASEKNGWYQWPLPAIREYDVEELVIYFEDLFQFFSLSVSLPVKQSFFTKPRSGTPPESSVQPQRTEEENVRIEELKRIQGEYLNYKNFEDNDDVRRIVWKIYARNKELVVRIPEVLDPYASHIYMYTSFYDALEMDNNFLVQTRGLDYFKNACWSIYSQLVKEGRQVKCITDQPLPLRHFNTAGEQVEYNLAASKWQNKEDLLSLVPHKGNALVCLSSLSSVEQVKQLVQRQQSSHFVLVELSRALRKNPIGKWLQWIFVIPENDFEKQGFTDFSRFAALRSLKQNEAAIRKVLEQNGASVISISSKELSR